MNFDEGFLKRIECLKKGYLVASSHCQTDNSNIYIIINRHIGDAIRVLQVLTSIKDYYGENSSRYHFAEGKNNINPVLKTKLVKKVIVVTTKSISGVARLFSYAYDELIVLDAEELNALEFYSCSPCAIHQNIICDENAYRMIYHRWKTDEGSWVRSVMVGCWDLRWYLCLPSSIRLTDAHISEETKEKARQFISVNGIDVNKTVILCPYAQSSSNLDTNLCNLFSKALKQKGYRLYTNAFGKEEVVSGTERIAVDIDILAALCENGCKVICVQSGLADVLVKCKVKNLIVLSVLKKANDFQFARSRKVTQEVNHINGVTYLRIEHFEEDYVLKLLMDNFH